MMWYLCFLYLQAKGKAGILDNVVIEVDCHPQHVVYSPFISSEQRRVYTPNRTAVVETTDGKIVDSRDNPRAPSKGTGRQTQWDNLHLVYFSGYAMWMYLTSPFLLKLPNVRTEEIEPWEEQADVLAPAQSDVSAGNRDTQHRAGFLLRQDRHTEMTGLQSGRSLRPSFG
jgi:hypothetical protein